MAGPQRASDIRRRGNLNAGIIVPIRGDVLDQVMATLYAQALVRNVYSIDMSVAGIQQEPVNHGFSVGFQGFDFVFQAAGANRDGCLRIITGG